MQVAGRQSFEGFKALHPRVLSGISESVLMSRSVPVLLITATLLVQGCFDQSELDLRRAAGAGGGGGAGDGLAEDGGGAGDEANGEEGVAEPDCAAPGVALGVNEGEVIENLRLKDRERERIPVYRGCGKVTIIGLGAGWCVGCREEMPHFVEWQEELGDDLSIYYVLWQNNASQPASTTFAAEWADEFRANFPIVIDPTGYVRGTYAPGLDLPTTILLDREMVIRKIRFFNSVERLRFDVDELIAE